LKKNNTLKFKRLITNIGFVDFTPKKESIIDDFIGQNPFPTKKIIKVNIMTPSGMHAEHSIDIIEKFKKNIVIEKPICLNCEDGVNLINCAEKNNIKLFAVHQNRYNKAVQKLKKEIDKNKLGKISLATVRLRWARTQNYYNRDAWRGTWGLDGGVLTNQAVHHIDILRWLIGDVLCVSAMGSARFADIEVEDTAVCWLKFKNGALGAIEATTTVRPDKTDIEASISVLTEKGTIIIEGPAINKITTWTINDLDKNKYIEIAPNVYGYGHNFIINNVVNTLNGLDEPYICGADALKTIRLLNSIYRSIELNGKLIYLDNKEYSRKLGIENEKNRYIFDLYRTKIGR